MTDKLLAYVIGAPGAGKSTLLRAMFEGWNRASYANLIAYAVYTRDGWPPITELGARREHFSGTDALAMNVLPKALEFLRQRSGIVVAEGDRLATPKFWDAARGLGWDVRVVLLDVPAPVARLRRWQREQSGLLPAQNETWLKGRATKVERLSAHADARLDGSRPPDVLAHDLLGMIRGWSNRTGS